MNENKGKEEIKSGNEGSEKNVEKVIPSVFERLVEKATWNTFGRLVPSWVTPNMMTLFGAIGSLIGIVFAFLARIHPLFLIGTCCGMLTHLICDNLDGFIARKRNLKSNCGAYFDLLVDITHITYLLIALSFSHVLNIKLAIFLVPVYALIIFTSMNEIHYLSKFSFPAVGPLETHLFFIVTMIGSMITGCRPLFEIKDYGVTFADIFCVIGGVPMYFEMIRLQISTFVKIRRQDLANRENEE